MKRLTWGSIAVAWPKRQDARIEYLHSRLTSAEYVVIHTKSVEAGFQQVAAFCRAVVLATTPYEERPRPNGPTYTERARLMQRRQVVKRKIPPVIVDCIVEGTRFTDTGGCAAQCPNPLAKVLPQAAQWMAMPPWRLTLKHGQRPGAVGQGKKVIYHSSSIRNFCDYFYPELFNGAALRRM